MIERDNIVIQLVESDEFTKKDVANSRLILMPREHVIWNMNYQEDLPRMTSGVPHTAIRKHGAFITKFENDSMK